MRKITQVSMLLIALFFMNTELSAQTDGDFEFLFDSTATDGTELEGWTNFGKNGAISVANGNLTYTYGDATAGFEVYPPSTPINLNKTNFPYLAIQLSHTPAARVLLHFKTGTIAAWYDSKTTNGEVDATLNGAHVFLFDLSGDHFTTTGIEDGEIGRIIFALDNSGDAEAKTSVDIAWIKTFASVQAIKDYAAANPVLSTTNITNESQTQIISGTNNINIKGCELNANVQVFNVFGQSVYATIANSDELSINIATTGIYIVKVSGENGTITKKTLVK